ncbi:hypothetical protein HYC85_001268 [Camellia sinensis]|uniref:Uncharacterized protein n=1 Tax=Camellia sinensis TaxID=4442 RepID=A0A7J7I564_CAMSI|nr:hypothetical protein HYC85_001268 [Camellia sinensis]
MSSLTPPIRTLQTQLQLSMTALARFLRHISNLMIQTHMRLKSANPYPTSSFMPPLCKKKKKKVFF